MRRLAIVIGLAVLAEVAYAPEPISLLSKMFVNRNLLKGSNISSLNNIQKLELLAFAKSKCEENGFDSTVYCGIKEKTFRGFQSNNSLKVWDKSNLSALEDSSNLIQSLLQSQENSLLIYPDCIKNEIIELIQQFKTNNKCN